MNKITINDKCGNLICSVETDEMLKSGFEKTDEATEYVFCRLYDVVYKPSWIAMTLLKYQIYLLKAAKNGHRYAHASINYSLRDNFVGLTFGGKTQAKEESCVNTGTNRYMDMCDPAKSKFSIVAIPVTMAEYNRIRAAINNAKGNSELKYDTLQIYGVPFYAIRGKASLESINSISLTEKRSTESESAPTASEVFESHKFVCSSFCFYILSRCSNRIKHYLHEKKISVRGLPPNAITEIPTSKIVASGYWNEYDKRIKELLKRRPEFEKYYN